ncbi:hypothetical protein [Polaromonas sp. SM01]|uniref:hypothetical protein n=1 Tax=Polaromonas sp. SM01 TaxID=3085630 RepID=UPI0029828078|nr:hypothetical protein [Polaromonas sp. SM01]MDW5442224.1 hypothetical protein [Polaromonas sp. SM01]
MHPFKLADLKALTVLPNEDSGAWLRGAEESVKFLKANAWKDEIVIYASASCVLIHGLLALGENVTPPDGEDLQSRNMPMPDDSWAIQRVWGSDGYDMYLEPPLSNSSKAFVGGEKLIYRRSFDGVSDSPSPIELSQKLVHSLDLYLVPERNAYCRLDARGDIEDVIKITQVNKGSTWGYIDVVTILRKDLDKFMALSNTCLVYRFDFTRVRWGAFGGWGDHERYNREEGDLFYHGGVSGDGSYANGAMIVRPQVTTDDLIQALKDEEDSSSKQYATFKIQDWKNNALVEASCGPGHLSNYFQKSDLPFELSPAFFRPDVLHLFKANAEKYTLENRSITCRGAWHLKTYDINEAGQVHTYVGYLADLPYEVQLYWQSFNEWPRGPISSRAFQTDFEGRWDTGYDPLTALKHTIHKLDKTSYPWWTPRGEKIAAVVLYPASDSPQEWADEILKLDQFLVEGFLAKPLKVQAENLGRTLEPSWGSLRVLQEVLVGLGQSQEDAKIIVAPMQKLHALRTTVKGHASVEKKKAAEVEARTEYGTFRAHFKSLTTECEKSLNAILNIFGVELS